MDIQPKLITLPKELGPIYPESALNCIRSKFEYRVIHPALIIPAKLTAKVRFELKDLLLDKPKLKDVYPLDEQDSIDGVDPRVERKVVLKREENIYDDSRIKSFLIDLENPTIRKASHEIVVDYDQLSVDDVLRRILPNDISEIPSSFEIIGCLAHVNLREDVLPYKHIIGRVILDKNKGIQAVVNKIGTIQNEFRTFPMEILSDDRKEANGLIVEVKEDNCKFKLDFSQVYWNSRLQHEHRRLVNLISRKLRLTNMEKRFKNDKSDDLIVPKVIVADACAGIGPFAVPLSKFDHVIVHANDLNPLSFHYLNENAKTNNCKELHTYNMDGRDFIRMLDEKKVEYQHVLMNLPAIAPEFLNVFRGWEGNYSKRPMIHVHCFGSKNNWQIEILSRCSDSLGCTLDVNCDDVSIHEVRNVSPKKNMYCVSFRLPQGVKNVQKIQSGNFRSFEVRKHEDDESGTEENESESKKLRTK